MLQLLEFLSYFDWLTPWLRFLKVVGRDTRTFFVPYDGRWSEWYIERLLGAYDIDVMALEVFHGEMFFHVDADKAPLAYQVLIANGVELL